jgi:1,4-alpha-glucan branching enzyme
VGGYKVDKAVPFAFASEIPPKSASVTWDLSYTWNDSEWMAKRKDHNSHQARIRKCILRMAK